MKSKTHLYFASFLFLSVLMASSMTMAQQTQPGDACDPSQEHHYQRVAGADNAGSGYELVCNGTEWKLITQWDTGSGQSFFQVGNDTDPCDSDKTGRLRYDSGADEWQYCNGSTWGPFEHAGGSAGGTVAFSPFTDLDNLAPGTLYSSNIVQIITADGSAISVSGSGSPEYRICAEVSCNTVLTDWTSVASTIDERNYLQLRATSSATLDEIRTVTASVGAESLTWSLRSTSLQCTETGSQTYNYTGGVRTLNVTPELRECLFTITVVGAGGNGNSTGDSDDGSGGGTQFAYTPSDIGTFHILVGQAGNSAGEIAAYGGGGGGEQYAGGGGASAIRYADTDLAP